MRTIETKLYTFDELSEEAKQKAIERERNSEGYMNYDWYSFTYEDYYDKLTKMGFIEPRIYFSGFWSQGDGAMFEYSGFDDALRLEFIETLGLSPMRKRWLLDCSYISGSGKQRGHYYHSGCCSHNIYFESDRSLPSNFEDWVRSFDGAFEDFIIDKYNDICHEIYRSLENEYDHLTSDEVIAEHLRINEYEFTEEGKFH
jgi:hypothetical protein